MTESDRAALIARQGQGARYDATSAPTQELAWMRSGTAYFNRLLNALSDETLDAQPSDGRRSRRHIIANTGYQARAMADFVQAACQKPNGLLDRLADPDSAKIAHGMTLPALSTAA